MAEIMRRSKIFQKADAILTADIEIRAFQPVCRTDDHWAAQARKMKWLRELQEKHGFCPILDGGDLFDKRYKTNPSHELLGWTMENLPQPFYTVPGNHDLPGKSIENYSNSAMAVLDRANKINLCSKNPHELLHIKASPYFLLYGFGWGVSIENGETTSKGYFNIALIHAMIYEEFEPFPGCGGYSAKEVMALLPDFDLIITGDNHQTFVREEKGRLLVNPGSFMRNDANQIDHKPCVFLWFAEPNTVEQVFIPIEQGVINRDYIDVKKEKETRLDAFVEKLGEQVVSGINFPGNLEKMVNDESVSQGVRDKVWQYFEKVRK